MARLSFDQFEKALGYSLTGPAYQTSPSGTINALAQFAGNPGAVRKTQTLADGYNESGGQSTVDATQLDPAFIESLRNGGYTFEIDQSGRHPEARIFDAQGNMLGRQFSVGNTGSSFDKFADMAVPIGLAALAGGALGGFFPGAPGIPGLAAGGAGAAPAIGNGAFLGETAAGLGGSGAITGGGGIGGGLGGAGFGGAGLGGAGGAAGAAGVAGSAGGAAAQAGFWGSALKTVAPVLGSVAGGLIQSNAAGKAAGAQTAAARAGIEAIQKALAPYQQAGIGAIASQQDLLGINGPEKQQAAIAAIQASPAFTSQQQLGENRILQNASATGGLRGGNTQAALGQFSPALLSQLIDQQYSRLGGLSNMGANAAAGVGSATANLQGQIGSAQAGQALANGSALTNVLGSTLNAAGQYFGGQQPMAGVAPSISTNTPFGQFQLGGGF